VAGIRLLYDFWVLHFAQFHPGNLHALPHRVPGVSCHHGYETVRRRFVHVFGSIGVAFRAHLRVFNIVVYNNSSIVAAALLNNQPKHVTYSHHFRSVPNHFRGYEI
jgi:hypothetical protein